MLKSFLERLKNLRFNKRMLLGVSLAIIFIIYSYVERLPSWIYVEHLLLFFAVSFPEGIDWLFESIVFIVSPLYYGRKFVNNYKEILKIASEEKKKNKKK